MDKPRNPNPMPEKGSRPFVMLSNIKAELMMDSKRYSSGSLFMRIETQRVMEGEVEVGTVSFALGGGVAVTDSRTGRTYGFGMIDVWNAFFESKGKEQEP